MRSEKYQLANRGVAAVPLTHFSAPRSSAISCSDGTEITWDEPTFADVDLKNAASNSIWHRPDGFDLAIRTIQFARTISVCALVNGSIPYIRNGFFEGATALASAVSDLSSMKIPLEDCVLLTDGCFGVHSPVSLLAQARVGGFVFCGGKANDETILDELDGAGVPALCTKTRLFNY
jgi:AICAR transformylase/IMP cyclohydrolase PurH